MKKVNRDMTGIHTFVICAYKESPYLEACIRSLLRQTVDSKLIIATSTPNAHITAAAQRYGIELRVNPEVGGICADWRFAYSQATTRYVTLAHQDDVYGRKYAQKAIAALESSKNPIIFFTDYNELRSGRIATANKLLTIKRLMLVPLHSKALQASRAARRFILSFGNPICCPSVTYVASRLPAGIFGSEFKTSLDWDIWEKLSRLDGEFIYSSSALMLHRIHASSETSSTISSNTRTLEDLEMFGRFWNPAIAAFLMKLYISSQKSNSDA